VAGPVKGPDGDVVVRPVFVEPLDVLGAWGSVCEADEGEAGGVNGWWGVHFDVGGERWRVKSCVVGCCSFKYGIEEAEAVLVIYSQSFSHGW
jgi:hypothetical protein